MKFKVSSSKKLDKVADYILSHPSSNVVIFCGQVGAGKTTLIQNICNKLNVIDIVTSPTFSIANEYITKMGDVVYHLDFYRVKNLKELKNIGFEEYLDSECYCFIEWPDIIKDLLDSYLKVNFVVTDEFRIIEVT